MRLYESVWDMVRLDQGDWVKGKSFRLPTLEDYYDGPLPANGLRLARQPDARTQLQPSTSSSYNLFLVTSDFSPGFHSG